MALPLPEPYIVRGEPGQEYADGVGTQQNFDALAKAVTPLPIFTGLGAPAFTPTGRALYVRQDGGAGTTLYVWEGAAWAAK